MHLIERKINLLFHRELLSCWSGAEFLQHIREARDSDCKEFQWISTWQWNLCWWLLISTFPKIKQFWWLEVRAIQKVCWSYYCTIICHLVDFGFVMLFWRPGFFQWRHWQISQLSCLHTAFGLLQSCRTKNRIGLWIQQGWIQEVSVCHWVAYRTIRLMQNYAKTSVIVVSLNLVYLYSFSLPLRSCSPFFE